MRRNGRKTSGCRRLLVSFLAAVLLLGLAFPGYASEDGTMPSSAAETEERIPSTEAQQTEETTQPPETTVETQAETAPAPAETTAATEETVPAPETTEAAQSTEAAETTLPTETTASTEPAETETTAGTEETDPTESVEPSTAGTVAHTEETAETAPTEAAEETQLSLPEDDPDADPAMPEFPYYFYFGLLHAHTDLSDGTGSVEEAFSYAARVEGLDFFAVTDHSNSFDNADAGSIYRDGSSISREWAAGKAAAAAVTGEDFLGIFGYEMTWQEGKQLGHINTFCTEGWQSRNQEAYTHQPTALENYYKTLASAPDSVSQFNHPGGTYGSFEDFAHYRAEYDGVIHLLEIGGEGSDRAYDRYNQALDKGWHVAPTISQNNHNGSWGDKNDVRTVILADKLTERQLFTAIREHRVYASEDRDLRVYFRLNGHEMGSVLSRAEKPRITATLHDPTDAAIGRVEVIADGGATVASKKVDTPSDTVTLSVPGGYRYYYLRITQPDGDVAVTAPVWVEKYDDLGIASFAADTELPVQGRQLNLQLTLYNNELMDAAVSSVSLSVDGKTVHTLTSPGAVRAGDTLRLSIPYTHSGMGSAVIKATVTLAIGADTQTRSETITLVFEPAVSVSGILVDGSHANAGLDQLNAFTAVAARANMDVTVFTGTMPAGGEILLITAPEREFEEDFLARVQKFAADGGSLILCGRAGENRQLNRLLKALGSSLRLRGDRVTDEENCADAPEEIAAQVFNAKSKWCEALLEEQIFLHSGGCSVSTGEGVWLVKGYKTACSEKVEKSPVLLAYEKTGSGGVIFAAGSPFLADDCLPQPRNKWDPPRANQTFLETLLQIKRTVLPVSHIADVRDKSAGTLCRVKGYVTAGTSKKSNSFGDTIYLQDATGGIAVVPFREKGIQVGAPMEIVGYVNREDGNIRLELIEYSVLEEDYHRFVPRTMGNKNASNYASHGGELLQVEGRVVSLKKTAEGDGISRLVLKDHLGDTAVVLIEDGIGSGADGTNTLAQSVRVGRTVRAMGICHRVKDDTVLRVRNCEEVVCIPPEPDPSNPKTGDFFYSIWH